MKLWEVLKALDENPWKVFSATSGDSYLELSADIDHLKDFGYTFLDVVTTCEVEGRVKHALSCLGKLSADWREVKRPVTWQEAIQAWSDGKKVVWEEDKVVWEEDAERRVFDRNKSWAIQKYQNHLLDQDGDAVTVRMISGGKWYVED